ncbi:MAG: BolA family protein [Lysobacteraceae bacterium]
MNQVAVNASVIGDPATRAARIRTVLEATLAPTELELIDESHKHIGHVGARDGRGHFALRIASPKFAGMGSVARHRMIYAALGELMQTDIHALTITTVASGETIQASG